MATDTSSDSQLPEFVELRLKPDALSRNQLPDIGFPVPGDQLPGLLDGSGELPWAHMLCWLQLYSSDGKCDWMSLELAMSRLTEIIAPNDEHVTATVEGDDWCMELRDVDLSGPLVTIQRGNFLIAAVQSREDGTLVCSVYRPLDAKSIGYLIGMSRRPGPNGMVSMRENNWEFALDQAAASTAAFYAYDRGESYLSFWEHGLGIAWDGSEEASYVAQRELEPMAPRLAATQLGVYYELSPEDEI
jgi:hypothetical protein